VSEQTKFVLAAVVAGVAGAGWVGAGAYAGLQAETALQALAQRGAGQTLRLSGLQHERGLLSSKGTVDLTWQPGCAGAPGEDAPATMRVSYTLSHLPMPGGMLRAHWQAAPTGEGAKAFQAVFGSGASLQGEAVAGLGGTWRTDMQLPAVALQKSGQAVQMPPSKGYLQVDGAALGLGWTLEKVTARGNGEALEMKDLVLAVDLKNRHLGTGTVELRVGTLSAGFGSLEGLSLKSEATEHGDRLDMSVTPTVKQVSAAGRTVRDVAMEMAIKGLDTQSVERLSSTFEASCGFDSLTAQESTQVRDAIMTVLSRGFSMGIERLVAKADDGAVDGKLSIELSPAAVGSGVALAKQLKSAGMLKVSGKLVDEQQKQMAVSTGFAVAEGDALTASFSYAEGLLKLNNRTADAGGFQQLLVMADERLHAAMSQPLRIARAAEQAPEAAPAAEAEPVAMATEPAAPAAPAAPPPVAALAPAVAQAEAGCAGLSACLGASLQAARSDDVEAVRRMAAQIEALPKPDLGNRAVSRKLNDAGLALLRQGAAAEAAAQLRLALKENPRDVEVAGNLGFALVRAGQPAEAAEVLRNALVLDPRRSSTWTPLAEALALSGRAADAQAALWVAFQWSGNRDKSLAFYADRAEKETQPALATLYRNMNSWASGGPRPALLASR
jgi:uncharacterized protein YdgA (DUF945 family)